MATSSTGPRTEKAGGEGGSVKEDYGYVFYPKRDAVVNGTAAAEEREKLFGKAKTKESIHKLCLKNVATCLRDDPFVRLMTAALKSKGCEVDYTRHISCEPCCGPVSGGFDNRHKQVAVCENNCTNQTMVCGVLRHELIHAFDWCRAKIDLVDNLEHIACTEIRAANFVHCSYTAAFLQGLIPFYRFRSAHQECVREKAVFSILAVRNVGKEKAIDVVDKVFDKCYNDLEPVGRRTYKATFDKDSRRAFREARYYGYRPGEPPDED